MNSVSSAFANLYLACGLIAAVGALMRLTARMSSGQRLMSTAVMVPLAVLYLIGMHRSAGIDYESYLAAYNEEGIPIPDIGYTALTWLTRQLGIGFSSFLLLQAFFTLSILWIVAKAKQADPVVVVVVYLLHLAIVRDMSQSRVGLAVAVYLLGQTQQRALPKALLYACAAATHITVVVLMFIWAYVNLTSRLRPALRVVATYFPLAAFTVYGVVLLDIASGIDPRVDIYLSWDDVAYGAPLESFGALLRTVLVVIAYLAASRKFRDLKIRNYVFMELAGAAILIGFAQYSIFAARLSNVAISMYPIGLGVVALAYRSRSTLRRSKACGLATRAFVAATMATLLIRPGSYDALQEVVPTLFTSAADWN